MGRGPSRDIRCTKLEGLTPEAPTNRAAHYSARKASTGSTVAARRDGQ